MLEQLDQQLLLVVDLLAVLREAVLQLLIVLKAALVTKVPLYKFSELRSITPLISAS